MRVIGLMSGTSYDGIDAAAADLHRDGDTLVLSPLGMLSDSYPEELRGALAQALPPAATSLHAVCQLDTGVGQAFAAAALRANRELCDSRAELTVSHGQTVYHWVADGQVHGTLQLGEPAWIAEVTGRPVVSGLRTRDVAAGGQGAPLVSLFDVLWLRDRPGRPAALNLGGIANLTVLRDGTPLAFDTGPGNALLDAAAEHLTRGRLRCDSDGALAARGTVHQPLLDELLAEPYYRRAAPKTTGKELFHLGYLREALAGHSLCSEDILATLTRLTAVTVADATREAGASEIVASGGGTRNPTLMSALRSAVEPTVPVHTSDTLGVPSAAKEPYAFTVLGYLTAHGLPATVPSCTGATHPSILGSLTPGSTGLHLPPQGDAPPRRLRIAGRS